jgi:hypothetical protein
MKTYSNCISCNIELQPIEVFTPCYDAPGGSIDSFDVSLHYSSYPYCEGCDDHIPEECKELDYHYYYLINFYTSTSDEDDDELPF